MRQQILGLSPTASLLVIQARLAQLRLPYIRSMRSESFNRPLPYVHLLTVLLNVNTTFCITLDEAVIFVVLDLA